MAVPTTHTTMDLGTQFPAGSMEVQRKLKINPFQGAGGGVAAPPPAPLRPSGKQWPR